MLPYILSDMCKKDIVSLNIFTVVSYISFVACSVLWLKFSYFSLGSNDFKVNSPLLNISYDTRKTATFFGEIYTGNTTGNRAK